MGGRWLGSPGEPARPSTLPSCGHSHRGPFANWPLWGLQVLMAGLSVKSATTSTPKMTPKYSQEPDLVHEEKLLGGPLNQHHCPVSEFCRFWGCHPLGDTPCPPLSVHGSKVSPRPSQATLASPGCLTVFLGLLLDFRRQKESSSSLPFPYPRP